MRKKDTILRELQQAKQALTAKEMAQKLKMDRTNVSRHLNELVKEEKVKKLAGRPIKFKAVSFLTEKYITFENLIGKDGSLKNQIQKAKAAILYPPLGLHTLIFGKTGTGKTMFAECMYRFALTSKTLASDAPFITFNCADYAQNPQLLYGHIFGVKKGAFTGAETSRKGLLEQANGGILFLDEIHRLPPEGQEMLFTFIDKGTFRPLGAEQEEQAKVLIIGATTETSQTFLTTFNRRIPMQIELPALSERSLDERLAIIEEFLQQEANRLESTISLDRRSLLAFLAYQPEGNIGQLKRDLKLVCAKAFLHYQTAKTADKIAITEEDLPLVVQKGLLRSQTLQAKLPHFLDKNELCLVLDPGEDNVIWRKDPNNDMEVYDSITTKLDELGNLELSTIDLEKLIATDVDRYFSTYVEKLSHTNTYREIISDKLWHLVEQMYAKAKERLGRHYDEKVRFAFALHLNATVERIKNDRFVAHPDLNDIRRQNTKEFQLALEFSAQLEQAYNIVLPLDEIGFITMFLTMDETSEDASLANEQVEVLVVMHGEQTATSMLKTAQELLQTKWGQAFDMPLSLSTEAMYQQVRTYIAKHQASLGQGVIILTDMGSPNNFGKLLTHEFGIKTRVISLASTMLVLESLRLATLGRTLAEIYQSVSLIFEKQCLNDEPKEKPKAKALVVACFTGEGVSAYLYQLVSRLVDPAEIEIVQMQSLEKAKFLKQLEQLSLEKELVAIVGTVELNYQKIPFVPAFDLFQRKKVLAFQELLGPLMTSAEVSHALAKEFASSLDVTQLFAQIDTCLQTFRNEQEVLLENSVWQALSVHLGFLIDKLIKKQLPPLFPNLQHFKAQNSLLFTQLKNYLAPLEEEFGVTFSFDDLAYVAKIICNNQIKLELHSV